MTGRYEDSGAEFPRPPCVGSGQVVAFAAMVRERCPVCGRIVRTVDRALVAHYPERVAPTGSNDAPTVSLGL